MKQAIPFIKHFEGLRLKKYLCPAGIWTFGYGSLCRNYPDMKFPITKAQAEECLINDIEKFDSGVDRLITVELNENQKGALISFAYNLGLGCLQSSSLRMRLNRGDYEGAASVLLKYVYGGGRILPGLVNRRKAEYQLFMS